MTDKTHIDLDAALAALERNERALRPEVSSDLQARVLGDAAAIAAERASAMPAPPARKAARAEGFRLFGVFDLWSGGAVAALGLCLMAGVGVGYEAGPEVMAQAGLADSEFAMAFDDGDGDGLFLSEDVL